MTYTQAFYTIAIMYGICALVIFLLLMAVNKKDYGKIQFLESIKFMAGALLWLPILFIVLFMANVLYDGSPRKRGRY